MDTHMSTETERKVRDSLESEAGRVSVDGRLPDDVAVRLHERRRARKRRSATVGAALAVLVVCVAGVGAILTADGGEAQRVVTASGDRAVLASATIEVEPLPASGLDDRVGAVGATSSETFFVWGGAAGGVSLRSGAVLDLAEQVWRPVPGAPIAARSRAAGVGVDGSFFVWGGSSRPSGTPDLRDGAIFDPATDEWRPLPESPPGTEQSMARAVHVGRFVVVAGGNTPNRPGAPTLLMFDLDRRSWSEVPTSAPVVEIARVDQGSVAVAMTDESGDVVVQRLGVPDGRVLEDYPKPGAADSADPADWVGLAVGNGELVVAVTAESTTTVSSTALGGDTGWQQRAEVDASEFAPGTGAAMAFAPGEMLVDRGWLLAAGPTGVAALSLDGGDVVRVPSAVGCVADAATAVEGSMILVSGGQACQGDVTDRVSPAGRSLRLTER